MYIYICTVCIFVNQQLFDCHLELFSEPLCIGKIEIKAIQEEKKLSKELQHLKLGSVVEKSVKLLNCQSYIIQWCLIIRYFMIFT